MIYLLLISLIIITYLFSKGMEHDRQRTKKMFLIFSFVFIILVCALRKYNVGLDTPKYWRIYQYTSSVPFSDFEYVYFEKGFILLMKICTMLNMPFEAFMFVCYMIMLIPIAVFIYNYSEDALLSVIIFICYMFFEFYLTGIRQALAMSIVLIGLNWYLGNHRFKLIVFLIFTAIAYTFHQGAIIALVIPFLTIVKNAFVFEMLCLFSFLILSSSTDIITALAAQFSNGNDFTSSRAYYFGTNSFVQIIIAAIFVFLQYYKKHRSKTSEAEVETLSDKNEVLLTNMLMLSVVLSVYFGENTSARTSMFMAISIIVLVPSLMKYVTKKSIMILRMILCLIFIFYFFITLLTKNRFGIMPYHFFWEN